MDMLREKEGPRAGEPSFSRWLPAFFAGILTTAWLGIGVWIVWANVGDQAMEVWPKVSGWLGWGRDFFFVTVLPYASGKLGKIGSGRERD